MGRMGKLGPRVGALKKKRGGAGTPLRTMMTFIEIRVEVTIYSVAINILFSKTRIVVIIVIF